MDFLFGYLDFMFFGVIQMGVPFFLGYLYAERKKD